MFQVPFIALIPMMTEVRGASLVMCAIQGHRNFLQKMIVVMPMSLNNLHLPMRFPFAKSKWMPVQLTQLEKTASSNSFPPNFDFLLNYVK
jgi:hypothetical protein